MAVLKKPNCTFVALTLTLKGALSPTTLDAMAKKSLDFMHDKYYT